MRQQAQQVRPDNPNTQGLVGRTGKEAFGGSEAIPLPLGTVMITITIFASHDVRFPASDSKVYHYHWTTLTAGPKTSLERVGSDGMNKDPDYLAAYCILQTNSEHTGHGMVNFLPSRLLKTGFN